MVLEFLEELGTGTVVIRPLAKRPRRFQDTIVVHDVWLILSICIIAADPGRKAFGAPFAIPCFRAPQLRRVGLACVTPDADLAEHKATVGRDGVSY